MAPYWFVNIVSQLIFSMLSDKSINTYNVVIIGFKYRNSKLDSTVYETWKTSFNVNWFIMETIILTNNLAIKVCDVPSVLQVTSRKVWQEKYILSN